jgi:ABC-type phosphate transport system substrate-binding protein
MFMRRLLAVALLGFFSLCFFSQARGAEGYKVIVHSSNSVGTMTAERVSAIFLKKVSKWNNGRRIMPVDLVAGSSAREKFSKGIHGKSISAIKSFWQQQVFSGRDVPPPEKTSDRQVIAYVEANPNAIGYVSKSAAQGNTKVLRITQ